jgi:hypothetical protein
MSFPMLGKFSAITSLASYVLNFYFLLFGDTNDAEGLSFNGVPKILNVVIIISF